MLKAYEYRIYPTSHQEELFNKTLGLCRLYWNIVVFNKNQDHSMLIQGYKPTFERFEPEALEWMKDIDTVPISQMWQDIKAAYSNFFRSCKKQRKVHSTTKVQIKEESKRLIQVLNGLLTKDF